MASLRARLFIGLALFILATGLGAGGLAFGWAFAEAIELQDAILLQIGGLAVINHLQAELPAQGGVDAEARVIIEEVGGSSASSQVGTVLPMIPKDLAEGLHTLARGGETWRVSVRMRSDGSRVAIGQPTAARDEIARDSALRTIVPLVVLIPCLMLVVGGVIHYSFRPFAQLAAQLDAKHNEELQQLPIAVVPEELRPFIAAINRLLERIAIMFDQQRRFIAHAAHELRTPITALGIQSENLERGELADETRNRLAVLKSGIRRTAHLLEQLLALAKYEESNQLDVPAIGLDLVAKAVVADFQPLAQARSVDLGFKRVEETPVLVESTGLAALVRNLVDNALRYSPQGKWVDVSVFRQGDQAILRVDDGGPGIQAADLDRIFEPFNRGRRSGGDGTGLGLSIVQRIVHKYQGSIILENASSAGETGLRVTVRFPLA
jgi:two-component system OmpR family sensor kinase